MLTFDAELSPKEHPTPRTKTRKSTHFSCAQMRTSWCISMRISVHRKSRLRTNKMRCCFASRSDQNSLQFLHKSSCVFGSPKRARKEARTARHFASKQGEFSRHFPCKNRRQKIRCTQGNHEIAESALCVFSARGFSEREFDFEITRYFP